MEEFYHEPREEQYANLSPAEIICATIHHCWESHPLKIERNVTLLYISDNLVLNLEDISSIMVERQTGDIFVHFISQKISYLCSYGSDEYDALKVLMHKLQH